MDEGEGFAAGRGGVPVAPGDRSGRRFLRWSSGAALRIIKRTRKGESPASICRSPGLPSARTVQGWMSRRPLFRAAMEAARKEAGRRFVGAPSGYCQATAERIYERVCEGEALSAVCADPAMPARSTVYRWLVEHPEFARAVRLARQIQGDALAEAGWRLAGAATPETAYLTHVRLTHLRWYAGKLAPRRYGPVKSVEDEESAALAAEPTEYQVSIKRFELEEDARGWRRVVGYRANPGTLEPEVCSVGEWTPPPDSAALRRAAETGPPSGAAAQAGEADGADEDPEMWL